MARVTARRTMAGSLEAARERDYTIGGDFRPHRGKVTIPPRVVPAGSTRACHFQPHACEEQTMSKGLDQKKTEKKKPQKSLKEKRAEKAAKKAAKGH